jgi:adenine deaminase
MIGKALSVARGIEKADLVLKNAYIVNVFSENIEHADVAITNGMIVGIGEYEGIEEVDCTGKFVAPGFIDGHIHLESSMLKPVEFAKAVLPHGTTAVIADPHEIANVCGLDGIEYMMEATKELPLDTYFVLPSCVPSTSFDESGCVLSAEDLNGLYREEKVLGLGEVMNYIGTINGEEEILHKIEDAYSNHRIVDGHAPGLTGKDLCAYVVAGVQSDHECTNIEEAKEKIRRGQWVMIREGTAAKNMTSLMDLFQAPYHQRTLLVTDDKHPNDLIQTGHIDYIIRRAIAFGVDPCIAIKMATFNAASYFGLKARGAIAPGYQADIVILNDLRELKIEKVYKQGKLIVDNNNVIKIEEPSINPRIIDKIYHSFYCKEIVTEDFNLKIDAQAVGEFFRVITLIKGEILTKEGRVPLENGKPEISIGKDIIKLAVMERHHNTNHIGIGFVQGYGLKKGAIASSVSHDSHNLIVIGTNEKDMAVAANCIREMQGGWAIALEGEIIGKLPLPIGGLMSDYDALTVAQIMIGMKTKARDLGVEEGIDPFMTLAFISLPVIPELRLITTGLIDVQKQCTVSLII